MPLETLKVDSTSLIKNKNISTYLAGLVEGDGSIKVPKLSRSSTGRLRYPSITIVFALKDRPLAEYLAIILNGHVNSTKGNYVVLSIQNLKGIYFFINIVNGHFRTPKINDLVRLIEWFNNRGDFPILVDKGLSKDSILENAWFTGFLEADGGFLITYNKNKNGDLINIDLTMRITQNQVRANKSNWPLTYENSYYSIMSEIAKTFNVKLNSYSRNRLGVISEYKRVLENGYLITIKSTDSRCRLIEYLDTFTLLSSKKLDYLNWKHAHNILLTQSIDKNEIISLKKGMNNNRTCFDWSHLND